MTIAVYATLRRAVRFAMRLLARARGRSKKTATVRTVRRVAYWVHGGLGDAVMAIDAVRLIRRTWPSARIDLYVSHAFSPIIAQLIDKEVVVIVVGPLSLSSAISRCLGRRYAYAFVNILGMFSVQAELFCFARASFRYGSRYTEDSESDRLWTRSLTPRDDRHDAVQNCDIVNLCIGAPADDLWAPSPAVRCKPAAAGKVVVIHPGAKRGYEYKRWVPQRFELLAHALIVRGYRVVVLIGPGEEDLVNRFSKVVGCEIFHAPPPDAFVDMLATAELFVGNDSGPAHVAAFLGTPTLTLIGPASPVRTAPRGDKSRYLYARVTCSPCHFSARTCSANHCMLALTFDMVYDEACRMLDIPLDRDDS